jgi:Mg2+-importing ATPase
MSEQAIPFWNKELAALLSELGTDNQGLTSEEASKRLDAYGINTAKLKRKHNTFSLLLAQFKSPIILLLLTATALSFFLRESTNAMIIFTIVLISSVLGFIQEKGAKNAMAKLLAMVQVKTRVLRDGKPTEISLEDVVPGDVAFLAAGDMVPADCRILESKDLFVDEATLTGETYPTEKTPGITVADAALAQRSNALFMGTHVISGNSRALVVNTGRSTEFGKISDRLRLRPSETEFERGVRRFGFFLMEITLILIIAIFAINVYLKRPVLDSFLFALALAVGLTPQLLPAIISINLSHGAKKMAKKKVIVKRLASIENFGSMNILCSDKTGTLTEGIIELKGSLDFEGNESEKVLFYAYLNAFYETMLMNPIDEALRSFRRFDLVRYKKLDEVPYDFNRKRLSVLIQSDERRIVITKGALQNILEVCSKAEMSDGKIVGITPARPLIKKRSDEFGNKGLRVLGIAYRDMAERSTITKDDETDMVFLGFLLFSDSPKKGIAETIENLRRSYVQLKIITGDNKSVAANVGRQIGLKTPVVLTGKDLHRLSDESLLVMAPDVDVFAEVEPNHKERIILALKKSGNVVGYMGDGMNDASALHAADVGISVDSAVDVAKEAADIVLLEKNLDVLVDGMREGRKTFANTLKYVFMATSANFGNMFSMAGISLFLPFLPLLPKQILLTNLMTDFPEMTIATDTVDREMVDRPRRWNIKFIRNFMMTFGLISSVFDYITFGVLLLILHATVDKFRTGWYMESVISAAIIVLVIRSRRPVFKSKPGKYLFVTTILIVILAIILPLTPFSRLFGFTGVPLSFLLVVAGIVVLYILSAELAKHFFYKYNK